MMLVITYHKRKSYNLLCTFLYNIPVGEGDGIALDIEGVKDGVREGVGTNDGVEGIIVECNDTTLCGVVIEAEEDKAVKTDVCGCDIVTVGATWMEVKERGLGMPIRALISNTSKVESGITGGPCGKEMTSSSVPSSGTKRCEPG